ncbi:hypothetical protein ACOMCU_16220 [Lysinibacillus sp. UGB7]|uniref:hypothetical protein n=1 Tax=Lysinibacillus sp. UGB7 TaxID=3411039 RepID=UPI003B7FCAB4
MKEAYLAFKSSKALYHALTVIKNCLSLVNDRLEYSAPIKLETCYRNFAKSFMESSLDCSGDFNDFRRFDRDYEQYFNWELSNDLAPRFYCKQWFSTVVGVLEILGYSLTEIEVMYYEFLNIPVSKVTKDKQLSLF